MIFNEQWISETDAQALMEGNAPQPTIESDPSHATGHDAEEGSDSNEGGLSNREYKVMKLSSQDYLCTIPVLQPDAPENRTANELAKAEEAKELTRATISGWDLLSDLGDRCLYFGSGWWTYRFCKNTEIVQFHAAAVTPPGQPPRRDLSTAEFVLGAEPAAPVGSSQKVRREPDEQPLPAEVQVKGEQRYLVQRLERGTTCDLTGRERTIEVQYHCVPGLKDARISWIKEVTICAYLMVVNTPKLCNDVAFLPPKETTANPISCQLIVGKDTTPPMIEQEQSSNKLNSEDVAEGDWVAPAQDQARLQPQSTPQVIGGVVVGGRNVLSKGDEAGKDPLKIKTPQPNFQKHVDDEQFVDVVAQAASKAKGGKVEVLGLDDLEDLDIDPDVIAEMREEVARLAGEAGWRIEVVDLPDRDRELRGYIDEPEGGEGEKGKKIKNKDKPEKKEKAGKQEKSEEGSEEKLKDEL